LRLRVNLFHQTFCIPYSCAYSTTINKERPMINVIPKFNTFGLRRFILILLLGAGIPSAQIHAQNMPASNGWQHVKYAIYFTSSDLEQLLVDSAQFIKTKDYFGPIKPYKVYL